MRKGQDVSTTQQRGYYSKYEVRQIETGELITGPTFTMKIWSDPHAWPALRAYADSVEADNPELAQDLRDIVAEHEANA